ncbi:mitochondrial cardiolipin hydrolase-like [Toxorhynchites rutilus septentrionalis]|uniref:mitochondrial cardiolipin hydrolase-like n=1 Tax=Toxorhynchites rutilus septentrionalis TaxID=329112 RepID=UPI00247871EF|nr:mitochondrial cardiolipin hydrolase-like [Toxorhynchites rutilus septentrionalis]
MKEMFSTLPRWVRVSAIVLGVGVGSEVFYEMYRGLRAYCAGRSVRQRATRTLTEVYFANERSIEGYTAGTSMTNFTTEHVRRIVAFLDRARVSINLCMYIVTVDSIGDAVLRAAKRGVRVRVIGCSTMAYSSGSQMTKMVQGGVPVRFNRMDGAYLMHHKFCLIDTDWLCARCYHAEKVRRSGFCCDATGGAGGDSGATQVANGVSRTGRRGSTKAQCQLADGVDGSPQRSSGCVRCDQQVKSAVLKCRLQELATEPLPLEGMIISGSTNWTMQALSGNWDNMIVTSIPDIVVPFQLEFQRLWQEFASVSPVISAGGESSAKNQQ